MAAVRVAFTWLGTQKSLTPEQRAQAAEAFDAEGQFLSAGKKLLDTRHPAFRAVTAIRGKIAAYWKGAEPAVPRAGRAADPAGQGRGVRRPDGRLPGRAGRRRGQPRPPLRRAEARPPPSGSGSLFNPADYPETLVGLFDVAWDFPSVEPPDYLRQL